MKLEILYEDEHIISVVKPYKMLSQSDGSKPCITDIISEYLTDKYGSGYVGVVHRLDVTTGGVMIFAKTKLATAKLNSMIKENKLKKTYLCVVENEFLSDRGVFKDFLYHDRIKNKTYVVKKERKGVKSASLDYTVLGSIKDEKSVLSLVKVNLHTGRTHQIRVQFAYRQHPLVGDKKYGSSITNDNIALWSYKIELCHPVTGKDLSLSADASEKIFEKFKISGG